MCRPPCYSWANIHLLAGGREDLRVSVKDEWAPGSDDTVKGLDELDEESIKDAREESRRMGIVMGIVMVVVGPTWGKVAFNTY